MGGLEPSWADGTAVRATWARKTRVGDGERVVWLEPPILTNAFTSKPPLRLCSTLTAGYPSCLRRSDAPTRAEHLIRHAIRLVHEQTRALFACYGKPELTLRVIDVRREDASLQKRGRLIPPNVLWVSQVRMNASSRRDWCLPW